MVVVPSIMLTEKKIKNFKGLGELYKQVSVNNANN
jgi:hypothetical protein